MSWRSASRTAVGEADREQKLATAYRSVFKGGHEDVEIVLADLATHCGFYLVSPPGTPGEALQYQEGMRAAFGRIFHFMSLDDASLKALEEAARKEAVQQQEGNFS